MCSKPFVISNYLVQVSGCHLFIISKVEVPSEHLCVSNTVLQPCALSFSLDFHKGPKRQGLSSCLLLRWEESGVTLSRGNSCCSWNWSTNSLRNSRITVHVQHSMRITVCRFPLMLVTSLQILPKWRTEICLHTERANHLCCAKLE